jgi:hypothetical protein
MSGFRLERVKALRERIARMRALDAEELAGALRRIEDGAAAVAAERERLLVPGLLGQNDDARSAGAEDAAWLGRLYDTALADLERRYGVAAADASAALERAWEALTVERREERKMAHLERQHHERAGETRERAENVLGDELALRRHDRERRSRDRE